MKLKILMVTLIVLGCSISVQAKSSQPKQLSINCEGQSCEEVLAEVRGIFPDTVAQFEGECSDNKTLSLQVFQNEGQPKRVSFICWGEPELDRSRSGTWLGVLPLTANDPTFVQAWTCPESDQQCQRILPHLRSRYPEQIQQAEFQCATKNGSLFMSVSEQKVDVRCGFFANSVWDEDGDGSPDNEDPVSVDLSVGTFKLK